MRSGLEAAIVLLICALLPLPAMASGTGYSQDFLPAAPAGFTAIEGSDFDVYYGAASEADVGTVEAAAGEACAAARAFFQGVPFHPGIIVASTQSEYDEILDAEGLPEYGMSSGWGYGSRSAIVIKRPGLVPDFSTAMAHEMAHVAARSYLGGHRYDLPEWFSEGLAIYVSGDGPGARMAMVEAACGNGTLLSIAGLERVHLASATDGVTADEVSLAYVQAGLLVQYIADGYGNGSLLAILDRFGQAGDLDAAFSAVLGATPDAINARWQDDLKAELDARDGRVLEQSVYGYVVDHHGSPMANVTVSFTALRNDSIVLGTVYTATSGDGGEYSANVTYGLLRVASDKPDYAGFNGTVELVRGQSQLLNVTLDGTALEERRARESAERERENMVYLGLAVLTALAVVSLLAVFLRSRRR